MKISYGSQIRFGLEYWAVYLDGRVLSTHWSREHAKSAYLRLLAKLELEGSDVVVKQ
jgi:hypothetical protein